MSVTEIERVKQDIATIKEAAGLELPFGWDSVWLSLIGLPFVGAWCLIYHLVFDGHSPFIMGISFVIFLAVLAYFRFKYRRSTGRSAIKRHEYGVAFYGCIFVAATMAALLAWAYLAGIDIPYIASGGMTMVGLMLTLRAFESKKRLSNLGAAIPAIFFGISIAVWPSPATILTTACITLVVAGPAMAFIEMYQLKQAEQRNDAD